MGMLTLHTETLRGFDSRDPTSVQLPVAQLPTKETQAAHDESDAIQLRIGVPLDYNIAELDTHVQATWVRILIRLQQEGHIIRPANLPHTKLALPAYYIIAPAEASSNLSRYDGVRYGCPAPRQTGKLFSGTRRRNLGAEARRRILLGSYSLSAAAIENHFIKAQQVRRLVQQDFDRVFRKRHPLLDHAPPSDLDVADQFDVLIAPTAQSLPPKLEDVMDEEPTSECATDVLTVPASLAGLPAISVPIRIRSRDVRNESDVASVGMQVIAQYGDDDMAFRAAKVIERLGGRMAR